MNVPKDLFYAKSHEWMRDTGKNTVQVGLSDYAQHELGDLVFVNLPAVGDLVVAGDTFADVESVKAVSDVYSPVTGTVAAINELLLDEPALINTECYDAWLMEVGEVALKGDLMNAEEYEKYLEEVG